MFSISIHAPLAGCDLTPPPPDGGITISIHAPLAGCDAGHGRSKHRRGDFNPRTPCGVRPPSSRSAKRPRRFQSTHPLRGATVTSMGARSSTVSISIHAPLAGCDRLIQQPERRPHNFNPRTPCGVRHGATRQKIEQGAHFNPRTPCGVRPATTTPYRRPMTFQSTHPLRGATGKMSSTGKVTLISIHAPLAGCDT